MEDYYKRVNTNMEWICKPNNKFHQLTLLC